MIHPTEAAPYLLALAATIALEAPVYAWLLRRTRGTATRTGLATGTVVNLASHPLAFVLLFPLLRPRVGLLLAFAVVEVVVVGVEAALLCVLQRERPVTLLSISYVANAISLSAGLLVLR